MRKSARPLAPELGQIGEEICRRWLISRGVRILARNYTCRLGEIDIVAATERTLVFVEVKTRTQRSLGSPLEAVNSRKQRRIKRVAIRFLSENRAILESDTLRHIRFDVATVIVDLRRRRARLLWIENAF